MDTADDASMHDLSAKPTVRRRQFVTGGHIAVAVSKSGHLDDGERVYLGKPWVNSNIFDNRY
jgi:hypothetical protein